MQVIIPLAGKGTRLRPHTHTKPKPLMHVAGKPVLGHILDKLSSLPISKVVFITGDMDDQIKRFVKSYSFKTEFVKQNELLGDGHAINLAKDMIDEDVLIVFVDTIFETDLSVIQRCEGDGIVWVKEVDDPQRFGIVTLDGSGYVSSIVEKPENPPSNLALIGLYYLKDSKKMFSALQHIVDHKIASKNEYRLADALSHMISQGAKIKAERVEAWEDCGKPETLLQTNRHLLEKSGGKVGKTIDSVIIQPVYIEDGAHITESVIGPHVSIAKGVKIEHSIISDSIISENAEIRNANLSHAIIGDNAVVKIKPMRLNIGDHSNIDDD